MSRTATRRDDILPDAAETAASVAERTVVRFEIKLLVALCAMLIAVGGWVAVQQYRLDDATAIAAKLSGNIDDIRRADLPAVLTSARADIGAVRGELQTEMREMRGEIRQLTTSINQLVGRIGATNGGSPIRNTLKD